MTQKNSVLVILFADIAQSTKLYDTIGNEAAHSLISACIAGMADVCVSHGGTVVKTIGDEVMVTFPVVRDAVEAAMALQKAVDKVPGIELLKTGTLDIYVGLDYGSVIEEDGDVFGDAVNMAARMVKLAARRQIIATRELIEALPSDFVLNWRCIDHLVIKGKSEKVPIYEIIWEAENITVNIKTPTENRPLIRHRLELKFGEACFEVSENRPTITIGRMGQNDIVIDDNRVSRFHARIEYRKDKYYLIDQSTNGTYVRPFGDAAILVQRDETILCDSGLIDLADESGSKSSPTAVFFKVCYFSGS